MEAVHAQGEHELPAPVHTPLFRDTSRFPREHRQKLHSTNPIERLHAEVKRRANVVSIFPNEAAITRLVGAILLEQNDEWAVSRRYMTLESIAPLSDGVPITLPAVAARTSRPYPPGAA